MMTFEYGHSTLQPLQACDNGVKYVQTSLNKEYGT